MTILDFTHGFICGILDWLEVRTSIRRFVIAGRANVSAEWMDGFDLVYDLGNKERENTL